MLFGRTVVCIRRITDCRSYAVFAFVSQRLIAGCAGHDAAGRSAQAPYKEGSNIHRMADDMLTIADDGSRDYIEAPRRLRPASSETKRLAKRGSK